MSDDKLPDVWISPGDLENDGTDAVVAAYLSFVQSSDDEVRYIPASRMEAEVARLTAENREIVSARGEGTGRCTCKNYPHLPTCGWDQREVALRADNERLTRELAAAKSFHDVAVAERNHERVLTMRLTRERDNARGERMIELNKRAKAEAERDAALEDQARYRWLRKVGCGFEEQDAGQTFDVWYGNEALDAAIDAARKQEKP